MCSTGKLIQQNEWRNARLITGIAAELCKLFEIKLFLLNYSYLKERGIARKTDRKGERGISLPDPIVAR